MMWDVAAGVIIGGFPLALLMSGGKLFWNGKDAIESRIGLTLMLVAIGIMAWIITEYLN